MRSNILRHPPPVANTDTASAAIAEGTYQLQGSDLVLAYTFLGGIDSCTATLTVNTQFTLVQGSWSAALPPPITGMGFLVRQLP